MANAFTMANPIARFWGTAGNCETVDDAFLGTLAGDGILRVEATHWLHLVMPTSLATVVVGGVTFYLVPLRLLSFLFVPAVHFTAAADAVSLPFFCLPLSISRFLVRLLNGGMDGSQCTDWTQVRDRICSASASLPIAGRTFDAVDLRSTHLVGCWLSAVTPALIKGASQSNAPVAQFLHILPDSYISSEGRMRTARPRLKAAMSIIMPADVPPASPDTLKAVRAAKFVALTNSEPPLDSFVEYDDIVAELNRRLQPTNEARLSPIFNRHFTRSDLRLTRFWGSAGNCALVDSAFLDTLTGDGVLNVETTHWLHHVMPNSLATVTIGGSTLYTWCRYVC